MSRRNLRTRTAPALQFFATRDPVETALRSCGQAALFALTVESTRGVQWKRPRLLPRSKMQEVTDFRSSPSDRSCQSPERSKLGNKSRLSCFHHYTLTISVLDSPTALRRASRPAPHHSVPSHPGRLRAAPRPARPALRTKKQDRPCGLRACRASPSRPRGPPVAAGSPCPPRAAPRTAAPARRAPSAPAPGPASPRLRDSNTVLIPCSV